MATVCLIHGAWHDASCWDAVVQGLQARGHEAVAPELPLHDPEAGFEERARPATEALEGATDPGVVVGHSMGSTYATLVAAARPGSHLVHVCPRLGGLTPPPDAPSPFREGIPFPADRPDGTSVWEPEVSRRTLYGRVPTEAAETLVQHLRPMAQPPDEYPLAGHPDNPTTLIYAANDEIFEPSWERLMASEVLGIEPIEIPGGHFPMAEDPDALTDLLDRVAGLAGSSTPNAPPAGGDGGPFRSARAQ